jgi:dihydroneopterin aldolase
MPELYRSVSLEDVRFFAFHGFYPEEQLVGTEFRVDLRVTLPAAGPVCDELELTFNYEQLYAIASAGMKVPRKLLETVAENMLGEIRRLCPQAEAISVRIRKLHPPIPGAIGSAAVELHYTS